VNSGAPEGLAVPAPLVTPVIFGTKKVWSFKTVDLLKEVQFI